MRTPLSHVIILRVDAGTRAAVSRKALSAGVSMSEVVRRGLSSVLAPHRGPDDPPPSAPAAALRPAA